MKLLQYKKYIIIFLIIQVIIFSIMLLNREKITNIFQSNIPVVIGGNFDINQKKIPVNAEYIEFIFSEDLDKNTINKDNISISPKLEGNFSLVNSNTIRFNYTNKLKVGDNYLFNFSNNIKSIDGINIKEVNFELNIVSNAKILKITPEGKLENLNQNFAVFFNIPMVPLVDLDSRDKLPCPISFIPEVKGKCSWTTTSVLEFIPENRLFGATNYKIKVENKKGLLYKIEESKEIEVFTPKLDLYISNNFSPKEGINFNFNFPVDFTDLQNKLILSLSSSTEDFSPLDIILLKNNDTNTSFNIKLKNGSFDYNKNYYLNIKTGLKSQNGNIPINYEINKNIKSNGFLSNTRIFKNIYSETGSLINTRSFYINNSYEGSKYIPVKDIFFNLTFEEEVELNKNNFSFDGTNFKISYIKDKKYNEKTGKNEEFINKKKIKLEILDKLENNKTYNLKISKNINKYLKEDIKKTYYTPKKLIIKDFKFINYSKSCLYLSQEIYNIWNKKDKIFSTTPKSWISDISTYDWLPYNLKNNNKYSSEVEVEKNRDELLYKKGYCREAKKGEFLYVIHSRLNPNSKYKINIKTGFEDKYGNKLINGLEKDIISGNILENDKYLYSGVSKDINMIPSNLAIVENLQTINLNKVQLEVCEMDELGYIDYNIKGWEKGFKPKCINQKKVTLAVKNKYWNLSNNRFDIEKDILKSKFSKNIILIKGNKVIKSNSDNSFENINEFRNIYIRSNINITYEKAKNKNLLFVTDFEGNFINDNLEFTFYNFDRKFKKPNKLDIKYNKNIKTGIYEIEKSSKFDYLVIKNKDKFGFLNLREDQFSNYDFKYISGETTSKKDYLYLYTERPIYKPGDTVYFKGILREFQPTKGYTPSKIKKAIIEVIDSSRKIIATIDVDINKNSNLDGSFIIPKDVNLGKFTFRFKTTKNNRSYTVSNNAFFHIEEYRKPTFKVKIESQSTKGFNSLNNYIIGDKLELDIKPEYYFGGKIINTKGNYGILTQNYFFDTKDYSNYQFGEGYKYFDCIYWGYCNYNDNLIKSGDFKIDNNGIFKYIYNFEGKNINGEKIYNFSFDVTDPDTKRVVSKTISKILHNTDGYVGIKSKYYNNKKDGLNLEGIILDFDAKPLSFRKAKIELIKREWKSVKKKGVDGVFYNDYSLKETLENTFNVISDKKGGFTKNIKTKNTGEYQIKVTYTGKNNKDFVSSKNIYIAGDDYISWHNDNNDITEFVSEKVQVKIGDKAEYMLKSPINSGKALIVIEKDDEILDYFIHDIKSYSDKINIDVKNNYYPNFYLKAYLIGSQENNPLPIYKRALIVTKVLTDHKKLNVSIKTNKQNYLPGEKVNLEIQVKDYLGNPVKNTDLSISLVDESLLALKGNPKKNPYAFFYDLKRYLGTNTYSSLKNLIKKLEVKDASDGEKGGAGEQIKGGDSKKKRGLFKDTAFWQASGKTDQNGLLQITISALPDNLTTWTIEVLANTKNDTKLGVNYKTIITSKTLMINDNLPRFFGSNDEIVLSPVIFNKTGKNKDFEISLNGTNFNIIGDSKKSVFILNGESKTVNFTIKVDDIGISEDKYLFNSKINIKATSSDNKELDEIEKFIQIKEVSTPEFVSTFGKTKDSSFEEKINIGKIKNSAGKLTINYSATLLNSITDGVKYLNRYPYGCSEQKTSAIMPNIFIKKLYNSIGKDFDLKTKMIKYWAGKYEGYKEKSLDTIIKEYLVNIRKYQRNDGGFVYFYDKNERYYPNYSNFTLTSYILESGAEIKNIGYNIDEKTYFDTIKYLKNRFYKNYREGCKEKPLSGILSPSQEKETANMCKYSEIERLKAINAILSFNNSDYEAYKMYKLLNFTNSYNSLNLEKVKVIAKLLKLKQITDKEKNILEIEANTIINKIINEELVFNPKGAYLGKSSYYSRFRNTVSLLEAISIIGLEKFSNIEKIIDNMNRWIISQKKNGSFGSTQDNIATIKAITSYLKSSGELKNIKNFTKLKINNEIIEENKFDDNNKLEVYTKILKLDNLKDNNSFIIEKNGNGTIYYDLNLSYYKNATEIKARDEGFFIETKYYKYDDYKKIDGEKKSEWKKYQNKEISYEQLKYPKNIFEYLTEVKNGKIGDLLISKNKIITTETRDKVSFEGFIPAGAELVNPNLDTSTKRKISGNSLYFDKLEYRTDRIFGYKSIMYPGIFEFTYLMRLTYSGEYSIKPSKISEFYNVEVFGRDKGKKFRIKK